MFSKYSVNIDTLMQHAGWQAVLEEKQFERIILGFEYHLRDYRKKDSENKKSQLMQEKNRHWIVSNPEKKNMKWTSIWNMAYWAAGIHLKKPFHLVTNLSLLMERSLQNIEYTPENFAKHGLGGCFHEMLWLIDNHYQFELKNLNGLERVIATATCNTPSPPKMIDYRACNFTEAKKAAEKLKELYINLVGKEWTRRKDNRFFTIRKDSKAKSSAERSQLENLRLRGATPPLPKVTEPKKIIKTTEVSAQCSFRDRLLKAKPPENPTDSIKANLKKTGKCRGLLLARIT